MSTESTKRRGHALVIGSSMAGLFAARVLSDHFEQVTLLERDAVEDQPESRRAQPQTRHLHGVLTRGLLIIQELFPGLDKTLVEGGAIIDDAGEAMRWYQFDGFKVQGPTGIHGILVSRPFLEWHIRRRVLSLPNVSLKPSCSVSEPILSADKKSIVGVKVGPQEKGGTGESLSADLTIDASGRGSSTPVWLKRLGFDPPIEREVKVRVGYSTRLYERHPDHLKGARLLMISPTPPVGKRLTYLFPIEADRWIVTAGGWAGDYPPSDEQGFLEFIRTLPVPDIYNILTKAKPLSDIITYRFPSSLRRHYENVKNFPSGYLVMGDAIASFNPVYGQGMSSAAMQAQVLKDELGRERTNGMWQSYFRNIAAVIEQPWKVSVGEDFRYPETEGEKPIAINLINTYVAMIHRATQKDPMVHKQFLKVMNLINSPASLMHPRIFWRVMRHGLSTRKGKPHSPVA